jgi:hypothetical protein
MDGEPKPHVAHLYRRIPNRREQRRADEIVAAHNAHEAACAALTKELGMEASGDRANAIDDELGRATERAIELQASTIEGLRAKASIILQKCWHGEIKDEDCDWNETMCRDLVGNLLKVAVQS